jgi:hypothetical protein
MGGLEANPGFLLPAMISVKEMRKRKEAAAASGGKVPSQPLASKRDDDYGSEDSEDGFLSVQPR